MITAKDLNVKSLSGVVYLENGLYQTTLANLQKDTYFTLKPLEFPKDSQVLRKDCYLGSSVWDCVNFANGNSRELKNSKVVFIGFTF